jgi:hypothetical protein
LENATRTAKNIMMMDIFEMLRVLRTSAAATVNGSLLTTAAGTVKAVMAVIISR